MAEQDAAKPKRFKIRHILLGLFALLLVWLVLFRIFAYVELSRRVRDLRAQGYPLSLEELNETYTLPPGADNAADFYLTAFSYHTGPDEDAKETLPWVGKAKAPKEPGPLDPNVLVCAEQFLAANEKVLPLLHDAVASEVCYYPLDFTEVFGDGNVPWLTTVRDCARLLQLEAAVACEQGDPNRAIASVEATMALGRSLNTPVIIHHLVSLAVRATACRSAEWIVSRVSLTDDQLQRLASYVALPAKDEGLKYAFVGERCFGAGIFRGTVSLAGHVGGPGIVMKLIVFPRKVLGFHDRDMLSYIDLLQDYIDATEAPILEKIAKSNAIADGPGRTRRPGLLTRILEPAFSRIVQLDVRHVAARRVALTALAVERYRLAEGRLPGSLSDLVPTYLEAVPEDPFDGQDLRFRRLATGYVVYSIGEDLSDDEGADRDAEKDAKKRDADGNVLWDITFFVTR